VPGLTVYDADDRAVIALSGASELRSVPAGRGFASTAELLVPAAPGDPWNAVGRVHHPGLGWMTYHYEDPAGADLGEGIATDHRGMEWGCWAGATVRSGDQTWTLDDLIRPETDAEQIRRTRRRFFRSVRLEGRVLGHRFLAEDGSESGRLTWAGEHLPVHHDRPYEWRLEWSDDSHAVDTGVFVAAGASALRFMAYAGTMLAI